MRSLGLSLGRGDTASGPAAEPATSQLPGDAAAALTWRPLDSTSAPGGAVAGRGPSARHGHSVTALPGGRLAVVGGVCSHAGEGALRDVHLLHTATMEWQAAPDCPVGVAFHTATFVPQFTGGEGRLADGDGQLVVLGGQESAKPRSMLSCTALHTQPPCSWSQQEAVDQAEHSPEPRHSHTAVLVDGSRIFVCGGCGANAAEALDDVWIFHRDTLLWLRAASSGAAFPARAGHSASLLRRQMLVFGGGAGGAYHNDLWAFDVDHHVWVEVR